MNQSVNDNNAKKNSTKFIGDLNATHKKKLLQEHVNELSQNVQRKMQPVTNISAQIDKAALKKLDEEFPGLISETNILNEQVKKLSVIKIITIQERHEIANKKVPLISLRSDLDSIIRENNKKFFFAVEKALDNTAIIDAHPHEATLFKVAVLYLLFYDEDPSPRVIEMSIALRKSELPHQFEYIEEVGTYREANYIELGLQAYIEVINALDENARNRFEASYEKFKKIYLGVRNAKQVNLDNFPVNGVNLPDIPDNLSEESPQSQISEGLSSKPLDRIYVNFERNELTTLQFLIPEHKKNSVNIPAIGGLALDSLMRACLSKQISIKETQDTELRKRTAAEKFILNASGIMNDGLRAMHDDKTGKMFDPHQGYVGWKADPDNLLKEITKEHEKYQKEQIITQDCKLTSAELHKTFFVKVMAVLKQALANELKTLGEKFEKTKLKTSFFDKRKLKNQYDEDQIEVNKKYQQAITEMENFKRIVEQVGAENIMIFAAEAGGKASYSLPKDSLVNDDKANAALAITPRI